MYLKAHIGIANSDEALRQKFQQGIDEKDSVIETKIARKL